MNTSTLVDEFHPELTVKQKVALGAFGNSQTVKDTLSNLSVSRPARSARLSSRSVSSHLHVRCYKRSNWHSASGVFSKRREIERRGLPFFKDWRFITLTVAPGLYPCPLQGYLAASSRMRHFMSAARKAGLWSKSHKWAWKLEFQRNGFPHWHLLVSRTSRFSHEELRILREIWVYGRTNVERVRNDDFLYSFKYAFKPSYVDHDGDPNSPHNVCLPTWFLDYYSPASGVGDSSEKPRSFARVRFWQTSKGFYTGQPRPSQVTKPPSRSMVPLPVRSVIDNMELSLVVISRSRSGKYLSSSLVTLSIPFKRFWDLCAWHASGSNAVFFTSFNALIPSHLLTKNILNKWQITPHLQRNRLQINQAFLLAQTCQDFTRS